MSLDALKAQRDEAKSDLETEREARRRLQRTLRDGQPKGPRFALLILHLDADVFLVCSIQLLHWVISVTRVLSDIF